MIIRYVIHRKNTDLYHSDLGSYQLVPLIDDLNTPKLYRDLKSAILYFNHGCSIENDEICTFIVDCKLCDDIEYVNGKAQLN